MGSVEFEKKDGRFIIKAGRREWEVLEDDWFRAKARIEQIIEGRPRWDQFPKSKIELKDRFDVIDQCVHQISFFNDHYITSDEGLEIRKLLLSAHDNFYCGQLAIFGSFPGMKLAGLMKDSGILHIPVY